MFSEAINVKSKNGFKSICPLGLFAEDTNLSYLNFVENSAASSGSMSVARNLNGLSI